MKNLFKPSSIQYKGFTLCKYYKSYSGRTIAEWEASAYGECTFYSTNLELLKKQITQYLTLNTLKK